jgi:hypothetical protein
MAVPLSPRASFTATSSTTGKSQATSITHTSHLTLCHGDHHSFIHVTPVAEAHLSNASPFQTPLITPNNKLIKRTNKDNFLPG